MTTNGTTPSSSPSPSPTPTPTVDIELNGTTYRMRMDFEAMVFFQEQTGVRLWEPYFFQEIVRDAPTIAQFILAATRGDDPSITLDDIKPAFKPSNMAYLLNKIQELWVVDMPDAEAEAIEGADASGESADPNAPSQSSSSTSGATPSKTSGSSRARSGSSPLASSAA